MRCVKCGKELTASRCAGCGFEHRGAKVSFLTEPDIGELTLPEPIKEEKMEKPGESKVAASPREKDPVPAAPKDLSRQKQDLSDFKIEGDVLVKYTGTAADVVIPKGIRIIGEKAFEKNKRICSVEIPEGVEEIGRNAFSHCVELKEALLPNSLKIIGESAFAGNGFERIVIPGSVKKISDMAFVYCYRLREIMFQEGIKEIGNIAFGYCDKLITVKLPKGLEVLGDLVFLDINGPGLEEAELPDTVSFRFGGNGTFAFFGCYNLKRVIVSQKWKQEHPKEAAALGSLLVIKQDPNDFIIEGDVLVKYTGTAADVVIPKGIRKIGEEAFTSNENICSVEIPEGVEEIRFSAFSDCNNLKSISFPNTLKTIGRNAFSESKLERIVLPGSVNTISAGAFSLCDQLREVVIMDGTKVIGEDAFYWCVNLRTVRLPVGLEYIDQLAFGICSALEEIELPDSVSLCLCRDETHPFSGCINLKHVIVSQQWKRQRPIEAAALGRLLVVYQDPNDFIIDGDVLVKYTGTAEDVIIPKGIRKIGDYAFFADDKKSKDDLIDQINQLNDDFNKQFDLQYKKNVKLSTKLRWWLLDAYYYDDIRTFIRRWFDLTGKLASEHKKTKKVSSVYLPEGVEEIGVLAFAMCPDLSRVHLPSTLKTIGPRAFYGDTALKSMALPGGLKSMGDGAFTFTGLQELTVPGSVEIISDGFCRACIHLESVELHEGVKRIGEEAFALSPDLKNLTLPDSLEIIEKDSFTGSGTFSIHASDYWQKKHPDLTNLLPEG